MTSRCLSYIPKDEPESKKRSPTPEPSDDLTKVHPNASFKTTEGASKKRKLIELKTAFYLLKNHLQEAAPAAAQEDISQLGHSLEQETQRYLEESESLLCKEDMIKVEELATKGKKLASTFRQFVEEVVDFRCVLDEVSDIVTEAHDSTKEG